MMILRWKDWNLESVNETEKQHSLVIKMNEQS